MPKVNLPAASWDSVLYILEEYARMDYPRDPNPMVMALHKEIQDQVFEQEY